MDGKIETGVTIMLMDKEIDHGSLLASAGLQIAGYTYKKAEKALRSWARSCLSKFYRIISRRNKAREQDHAEATYTKILKRRDGKIDWNEPAEKIYNLIRALNPDRAPGAYGILRQAQDKLKYLIF